MKKQRKGRSTKGFKHAGTMRLVNEAPKELIMDMPVMRTEVVEGKIVQVKRYQRISIPK